MRPRITEGRREALAGFAFVTPQIIGFSLFAFLPIAQVFWLSLNRIDPYTGATTYIGLENFRRMLVDPSLPAVLSTTGVYVAGLTAFGTALALLLAILVNQQLRGISLFRAIYFVPALITLAAWTLAWRLALQPDGLVDGILLAIGVDAPNWLNEKGVALAAVIVLQGLKNVGINMMIILAALQSLPRELHEAAYIDGAGVLATFRKITLPLLSPVLFLVTMMMLIGSFKVFEQIYLLTHGGPEGSTTVLSYLIYEKAFIDNDQGYASALAVLLFVLVLALTMAFWLSRRRLVFQEQ